MRGIPGLNGTGPGKRQISEDHINSSAGFDRMDRMPDPTNRPLSPRSSTGYGYP